MNGRPNCARRPSFAVEAVMLRVLTPSQALESGTPLNPQSNDPFLLLPMGHMPVHGTRPRDRCSHYRHKPTSFHCLSIGSHSRLPLSLSGSHYPNQGSCLGRRSRRGHPGRPHRSPYFQTLAHDRDLLGPSIMQCSNRHKSSLRSGC